MKNILIFTILLFSSLFAYDVRVEQTDWMGGSGVSGPVTGWGTQYVERESVTTATPGVVSLVAIDWDYSAWVSHTLYSGDVNPIAQGTMPADIDGDGDKDIIAVTSNGVTWFECIAPFSYISHSIDVSPHLGLGCVYPSDLNGDGKIDILLASTSVGWFENIDGGITWNWHIFDMVHDCDRISAADFDNDGDNDVLVSKLSSNIILLRNNEMDFTYELIYSPANFRIYPADFNNDGYLDFYSVGWGPEVVIFLNDGTGHFTISYTYYYYSGSYDGTWAQDMDNDGDMDIVTGASGGIFHGFLNDGTGTNFVRITLVPSGASLYSDGAMAADIDLDGFSDMAGTYSAVGWYRQLPTSPLNFSLHTIEPFIPYSHWIYVEDLDNGCAPDPDIIVTGDGTHIVYENNMILSYASIGTLASSILDAGRFARWLEFGWDACIPYDNSISFYWRVGDDIATFSSIPWNGPIPGIVFNTPDSMSILADGRYFQYKVEFHGGDDIAALHEVWVEYDTFAIIPSIEYSEETDCDGVNIVEVCFNMSSPDTFTANVSVEFSSDAGISWDVVPATVTEAEGDLGSNVEMGEHCFNWILSTDLPGIESDAWKVRIITTSFGNSDTAYYCSPLDSRPPDVDIFDYPAQIQFLDSVILNWTVEDMFWSHDPGTLFAICGTSVDTQILSDTFFVWHPNWATLSCDSVIFRVVMRDSFCNWGEDTCITRLCPDVVPLEIIPIDTLSKCFDFNFTMRFVLMDSLSGIDYSSLSTTLDGSPIDYNLIGDTIIITGGDSIHPQDTAIVCISVSDSNTICPPNDTSRCWYVWRCPLSFGCLRMPNPFTPNDDLSNDYVQFTFPGMELEAGEIFIYDVNNVLVRKIDVPAGEGSKELARWKGLDKNGQKVPIGLYLYVVEVGGEVVCDGTVTVAR